MSGPLEHPLDSMCLNRQQSAEMRLLLLWLEKSEPTCHYDIAKFPDLCSKNFLNSATSSHSPPCTRLHSLFTERHQSEIFARQSAAVFIFIQTTYVLLRAELKKRVGKKFQVETRVGRGKEREEVLKYPAIYSWGVLKTQQNWYFISSSADFSACELQYRANELENGIVSEHFEFAMFIAVARTELPPLFISER